MHTQTCKEEIQNGNTVLHLFFVLLCIFSFLFVLLFAIARQLVVNHSSAVDTLLGVAAVALIFVIKKFLHTDGDDAPAGDGRP